jgi:hypothetical protein
MFRVTYSAELRHPEEGEENQVEMSFSFDDQPAWTSLAEKFLDFLKGNGYIFDYNARLGVIKDVDSMVEDDFSEIEDEPKPKGKKKQ